MSIIYDALKKVEEANTAGAKPEAAKQKKHPKPKVKSYFLYALIVCLGFFIGNLVFGFLSGSAPKSLSIDKNQYAAKTGTKVKPAPLSFIMPPAAEVKKKQQGSWVLSGVFFSENEGYALINNQIAKEGDVIDGATVKRISLHGVELESAGSTVKLSSNP
jgi:hypothetical protein